MATSWAGLAVGAVGLAVAEAVLTRQGGAQAVGGWLEGAGTVVAKFISPAVPAFNTSTASSTSSAASTPAKTTPAQSPAAILQEPGVDQTPNLDPSSVQLPQYPTVTA